MSRSPERLRAIFAVAACAVSAGVAVQAQDAPRYSIGRAPTADEIAALDIDVRPDGHGLRKGRGTVAQGQQVYDAQCASCHGTFGESNRYMAIAGGVRAGDLQSGRASALKAADVPRTLGMKLNYATTLYDYIYRAMPWTNPQSLTADQTYAVTAYVLHLNEIVPADFELSDRNILQVQMPNRNGMTTAHGLASVKGKPDAQGSACMRNCASAVTVASELPRYARNQHGNLAEQKRPLGPARGIDTTAYDATASAPAAVASAATVDPKALVTRNACTGCHGLTSRIVGPGFNEVAARYQGRADAEAYLMKKIKSGGDGVWGAVPMPPQALKEEDALLIARWIVGGAR